MAKERSPRLVVSTTMGMRFCKLVTPALYGRIFSSPARGGSALAAGDLDRAFSRPAEAEVTLGRVLEPVPVLMAQLAPAGAPVHLPVDLAVVDLDALGRRQGVEYQLQLHPHHRGLPGL